MFGRDELRLLLLSVAIVTISTLPVFLTGAAFFEIGPELGMGPLGLGVLTGCFFLTASLTSAPLGRWIERVGWRRAMRINVVTSAALTGLVAPLAHSPWSLGGILVAAAVAYGSSNPAANLALARHTAHHRTATVFGLKHAGIPMSTLLAGLAVPALVVTFGWRTAFGVSSVLALSVWPLIPRHRLAPAASAETYRHDRLELGSGDLRRLATVAALGAVAAVSLGTFMVSAALEVGLTEPSAGWLQFAGSAASIWARIVSGVVVDRWGGLFAGVFSLLAAGAAIFLLLPIATGFFFAVGVLGAYATGWGWPGLLTAGVVDSNRSRAASSSAVTQAGVFLGAGGGPLVLGLVVERWSFRPMWVIVAVCLAVAAALVRTFVAKAR